MVDLSRLFAASLFAVTVLLSGALTAHAESEAAGTADRPLRLVVLNVPGGGTDGLIGKLQSLEGVTLQTQEWFIAQIKRHGLEPNGIMANRKALRILMRNSEIDYLLFLKRADQDYNAVLLEGPAAEPTLEFGADRSEGRLSTAGAETIRQQLATLFAPEQAAPTAAADGETSESTENEETDTSEEPSSSGVHFRTSGRGRFFRRNFNATGADNTNLAYVSRYYPGFEVDARVFPFGPASAALSGLGLHVDFNQGFETLTVPAGDNRRTPREVSLTHTELEGGLVFAIGEDAPMAESPADSRFQLKATARHSWFIVGPNDQLPSTSMTALMVGGRMTEPFLGGRLAAQARLEVIPVAFFRQGGALFGQTSYTNGFATRFGLLYALSDHVALVGGYRFRLHHSRFRGRGAAGFRNAEVFELVQGIDVGIQYGR